MQNEDKEKLTITQREMDRLSVIRCVIAKKLTWREAAQQLDLSLRQIGNLAARVRSQGNKGIIHGLRGRPSNHQIKPGLIDRAIALVRSRYPDFRPTFACEKLKEKHKISLSRETLRKAMIQEGIWRGRKKEVIYRSWRQRRSCLGEMVQLDGSHHDWFEGRSPRCVLVAFVDDATSQILHAEFVSSESALELFRATKNYLLKWGRPLSFYVDKHAIFYITEQTIVESHLRDPQPMTHYTRAMADLGIEMIPAHSPQAKGRVERSFETLQDRLIKEMRLRNVSNQEQGNRFLQEFFINDYNRRFGISAANAFDTHRTLDPSKPLDEILCFKTQRTVLNDFTLRFQNGFFQILKDNKVKVRPKERVMVHLHMDGTIHLNYKGKPLNFKPIVKKQWSFNPTMRFPRRYDKPLVPSPKDSLSKVPPWWRISYQFEKLKIQHSPYAISTLQK